MFNLSPGAVLKNKNAGQGAGTRDTGTGFFSTFDGVGMPGTSNSTGRAAGAGRGRKRGRRG